MGVQSTRDTPLADLPVLFRVITGNSRAPLVSVIGSPQGTIQFRADRDVRAIACQSPLRTADQHFRL